MTKYVLSRLLQNYYMRERVNIAFPVWITSTPDNLNLLPMYCRVICYNPQPRVIQRDATFTMFKVYGQILPVSEPRFHLQNSGHSILYTNKSFQSKWLKYFHWPSMFHLGNSSFVKEHYYSLILLINLTLYHHLSWCERCNINGNSIVKINKVDCACAHSC